MFSLVRITDLPICEILTLPPGIPRNISFMDRFARRNLPFDIYRHRVAGPTFDELFFAKMPIHRLFNHLDATEIHELSIRFQPTIEGHADLPWTRKHLRVFNGCFIANGISTHRSVALDDLKASLSKFPDLSNHVASVKSVKSTINVSASHRPTEYPMNDTLGNGSILFR